MEPRVDEQQLCQNNGNDAMEQKLGEQTRKLQNSIDVHNLLLCILAIEVLLLTVVIYYFPMNPTMATIKSEQFAETPTEKANHGNEKNEIEALKKSIELMKGELVKKDEQLTKLKNSNNSGLAENRNQLLFNGPVKRSRINWTIRDFGKLVAKNVFKISSPSIKLFGFQWKIMASTDETENRKEWLNVYLCHIPPSNYNGPYSIIVNFSFRITNKQRQNDDEKTLEKEFKNGDFECWGYAQFAKFENLLDQNNGFITADGKIYIELDFQIKSMTIEHMQIGGFK